MSKRYEELRVRAYGRRTFIKLGGAALTGAVLGGAVLGAAGCESDEGGDCGRPQPDPDGPGADGEPGTSVPPAEGWGDELPPITPNDEFYTVGFGVSVVDPCTWQCEVRVGGAVGAVIDLDLLASLPARDKEHTLQCIESQPDKPAMNNAVWSGLPLAEVLAHAGFTVPDGVDGMTFHGADGYSTGLPLADLETPAWLVWRMNGEPLPPEHGFPARILAPNRLGYLNAKYPVAIDFVTGEPRPDWQAGWATDYLVQGLFVYPEQMALRDSGETVRILGKSYAGSDPIVHVGVSTDGGETFAEAELTYAPGPDRWTLWRFDWRPPAPGTYDLVCQARTESGRETDPGHRTDDLPYGGGMSLQVEVREA